jgi:hypothetical protein
MIEKPARGRPPKPTAEQAKTRTIRLNDADFARFKALGIEKLRKWLRRADRAKVKE